MAKSTAEIKKFDAEVGKVLNLMIHSLYTNKDIFLRELISNASDALDKLRYLSIETPELYDNNEALKISVSFDSNTNSVTITDNGIGMSKEDLIKNLGTIASSGTQKFIETLSKSKDSKTDVNLIGQFGVGFYSAFMVAKNVTVFTRKAGEQDSYSWESDGHSDYKITKLDYELPRGTKIVLSLNPESSEFLDKYRLKHIIQTYSDHISFPIELSENDKDSTETVNSASALWTRSKNEISEEQYKDFYHHVAHLPDEPWLRMHNKTEGNIEYTSLLYVPSMKPFDLFHPDRKTRVKLYVKRVFITDENAKLIPEYLRFMRGVVDSEDLPLNISRETLQHNATIDKIRKSLVKKILSELKSKAKNDPKSYATFWGNFGEVMKEGLCEGALEEKEQLLEVCRFYSLTSGTDLISLDDYIEKMRDGQDEIFYITGDNLDNLRNHPMLEGFKKRNIDVLLMPDHVDDFWVNVINQFKNKELKSISVANLDLDKIQKIEEKSEESSKDEPKTADIESVINFFKETLGTKVKDIKTTSKLVDSPACLALPEGYMSIRMEKLLIEQKQLKAAAAKILEINPNHALIKTISKNIESESNKELNQDLAHLVFDQACILEGEKLDNPKGFADRLNKYLKLAVA